MLLATLIISIGLASAQFRLFRSTASTENTLSDLALTCTNCEITPPPAANNAPQCQQRCQQESTCASGTWVPPSTCTLYTKVFGLEGATISARGNSFYFEKQLTDMSVQLNRRMSSANPPTMNSYLVRYREPQNGRLSGRAVMKTGIATAEECAAMCTRYRGQVDPVTGDRCNSFNYNSVAQECELVILLAQAQEYSRLFTGANDLGGFPKDWEFYERISVPGCWVTQSECRRYRDPRFPELNSNYSFNGTFMRNVQYEWECAKMARFLHEDVCDNDVLVPTVSWWGGVQGSYGIFESWNSWDQMEGCVISLIAGSTCTSRTDLARFHDTFRDSIGEEDRGAALNTQHCFNRALMWHNLCQYSPSQPVEAFHAASGQRFSFPTAYCSCDDKGVKIDPTTQRRYCTRKNPTSNCVRSVLEAPYTYPDILCEDINPANLGNGRIGCQTLSVSECWVMPPVYCPATLIPGNSTERYFQITSATTKTECETATGNMFQQCGGNSQIRTVWTGDGTVFVHLAFQNEFITSTARVLWDMSAFTPPRLDALGNRLIAYTNLTTGRSMRFIAGKSGRVRHMDVWFRTSSTEDVLNLTLTLFFGPDINGRVIASGWTVVGPNATAGGFVHFALDSGNTAELGVVVGQTYTWQLTLEATINVVTTLDTGSPSGYIGFVGGNRFPTGSSDFSGTIDYPFVAWYEFFEERPAALLVLTSNAVAGTFLGIWFIVLLVLYCCFACWLGYLHRQRLKEEEKERAQIREIRENGDASVMDSDMSRQSSTGLLAGSSTANDAANIGPPRTMHQVPSVAPSEEHSEAEELVPPTRGGSSGDKQRAYV